MLKGERKLISAVLICLTAFFAVLSVSNAETKETNEVIKAIKLQVEYDEKVNFDRLKIDMPDGIVILKGEVNTLLAKERLVKAVENIRGHKGFLDLVKVVPENIFPDTVLTLKIENALIEDPVTDAFKLSVRVLNGQVVLDGRVDSFVEKTQAENIAKNTEGVKAVESGIEVVYPLERLDSKMKREIVSAIQNDIRLEAYLLEVEVENGIAHVSGIVGSQEALDRLMARAWVYGIKDVDTSEVSVKEWARNKMKQPVEFKNVSDAELKETIHTALILDPRVFANDLEVEVNAPFVTLRGTVSSKEVRTIAENNVMNIRGVISVNNLLKVKSHDAVPTDSELENYVKNTLLSDRQGRFTDVEASATLGWVYLSGYVKTEYLRDRAEKLIMSEIEGVREIQNNLEAEYESNTLPDWMISGTVRYRLNEDPFINSSRIEVSTNEGLVSLEGQVQNFTEYDIAENVAYQCGAKAVVNDLTVTIFANQPTVRLDRVFTAK